MTSIFGNIQLDSDEHCNQRVCLIFPKLGTAHVAPCRVLISKPVSAKRTMNPRKQKTRKDYADATTSNHSGAIKWRCSSIYHRVHLYQECLLVPRRIIKGNLQVGGKQLGFKNVKAVHLQKMGKSEHRFEEASGDFI